MAWLACIWDRWCSSWRLSMTRQQRDVAAAVRDKLWPLEAGRPVHHGQIYRCRHLAPPIRQACRCPTARRAVGGVYGSLGAWHRPPAGCVACELSGQPKSTVGRRAGECRHCSDLPAMPPHVARRPSRLALMPAYAMHGPQDRFRGPVVVFRTTAAMFRRRAAAAAVLLVLAAAAATVDAGVSTCRAVPPLLPLELACSTRWERSGLRGTLQTYHGSCAGGLSGAQTQLTPARPNSCSRVRPQGWQQEVQAAKRVLQHQRKCRCRPLARPRRCCPRLFAPTQPRCRSCLLTLPAPLLRPQGWCGTGEKFCSAARCYSGPCEGGGDTPTPQPTPSRPTRKTPYFSLLWGRAGERWAPSGRLPDWSFAGYMGAPTHRQADAGVVRVRAPTAAHAAALCRWAPSDPAPLTLQATRKEFPATPKFSMRGTMEPRAMVWQVRAWHGGRCRRRYGGAGRG